MFKKGIIFFLLVVIGILFLGLIVFWEVGPVPGEEVTYLPGEAQGTDSVEITAGGHYAAGRVHRFILGGHYRDVWTTPVRVPVLEMDGTSRQLTIDKRGGGQQTTSFRLSDEAGFTYALRSVDKDPLPLVSPFWQETVVGSFLRDQVSATHPFGALVVPVLAEAVGVMHATPKLVFVRPSDPQMEEEYAGIFGKDKLYMLEEKFTSKGTFFPQLGRVVAIEDSEDMLSRRFRSNSHHVDQKAFARARLLDLLIGDWDRHQGQWNWAAYQEGTQTIYRPIPKDRDQAFSYFRSGLIPTLTSYFPTLRKFTSFRETIDNVEGLMVNPAFLDERALPALTANDFREIALDIQASLTDSVIHRAVARLPGTIYHINGPELEQKLRGRRNQLPKAAQEFYRILAREVTVVGSDEEERFEVQRLNDHETSVRVLRLKGKGKKEAVLYSRVFQHADTRQITLHGLAGDDEFEVFGTVNSGIPVIIRGGEGEDLITDRSSVRGWRKHTIVYDTAEGNKFHFGSETQDRTTSDVAVHAYDREGLN
jgi:hypothetical protein